ncbi:YciI family protein [Frigidibacter sp. MR17.24]|uniref:YciI family protein n=1 Tax=Frigidibacter sp. MR17.24 TaxID=3127345 RepID=UPI003012D548
MRVMVLVKATEDSEAGLMPTPEALEAMGRFNEELAAAGVLRAGDGLKPSRAGARVAFDGTTRTIRPGPFAAVSELVAGFWIWEVEDLDAAIAWVLRAPNPMPGPSEIEIRPIYAPEDFGPALSPDLAAREAALRAQTGSA